MYINFVRMLLTDPFRCLLGWCPIFDTSALVKVSQSCYCYYKKCQRKRVSIQIIFDDVIAEFLSSIGWDHRSRACSQYFTITPYSKFFEFIFSCIGITCITEDSAVCGMTLRCGDRVDIILFVCHIWDGFLSGHVVCDEGNDDDDSSKFIKHVITLLCVVLGGITVPQNETLIVDTPSQWSPSNATKYLESGTFFVCFDKCHNITYVVDVFAFLCRYDVQAGCSALDEC